MDLKEFGARLASRRNELGFSQADLANQIGITRQYLSLIESGDRSCALEVLVNISEVLATTTDHLLLGDQAVPRTSVVVSLREDEDLPPSIKDALVELMLYLKAKT